MALDFAIWQAVCRGEERPTLRCYRWSKPTITLGYGQDPRKDICWRECHRRQIDVIRRPTGGGAIYHDLDFTYSFSAPTSCPLFPDSIDGSYLQVSRCLIEALRPLGIPAELSGASTGRGGSICFLAATPREVVVGGKKLIGSAQRRNRKGFLQQGSLLMNADVDRFGALFNFKEADALLWRRRVTTLKDEGVVIPPPEELFHLFRRGFEKVLEIDFEVTEPSPAEISAAQFAVEEGIFRVDEEV